MGCIITVHILLVGSGIIIVCIVILLSARVSSFVNDPVAAVFTFSRCEVEVFVPPPLPSVVPFFVVVLLQSVTVIKAIVQFETDVPPSSLVVEAIVLFLSKIAFKWLGNIYAHQKSADGTITVAYCPTKEMVSDYLSKPLQGSLFRLHCNTIMGLTPEMVDDYSMQYMQAKADKAALVNDYSSK